MITRSLYSILQKTKKSVLLLGPRQTGKSTLVASLNPDISINLAHEPTYLDFARNPRELEDRLAIAPQIKTIFIDEVQRLPSILNTLQFLLDKPHAPLFFLTGSSARKLKRGNANLLPGRIHSYFLGPLVTRELQYDLPTKSSLAHGTLPGIFTNHDIPDKEKTLRTYAATYLKEEVQAENLSRNLEGFARFLQVSAEWSGHFLDLAKMAGAAQIARQSAVRFFEILEDCLIVCRVNAFSKSLTRRLVQHPKFYFFDVGVLNGLLGNFYVSADRIGILFEHLVASQLWHSASALDQEIKISSFRTEHGAEVDFIVEKDQKVFALELKASTNVGPSDTIGLKRFSDYYGKKHSAFIFYLGHQKRVINQIEVWPWQDGLKHIGF